MGQGTSEDQVHLFEQPVQQDETITQKQQQQSQIPMGQGALMALQQQIQQPNLQMQLMEQMRKRVCLLEPQVQKEMTQQEQQRQQQTVMGQGTSGEHLLEQSVQLEEHIEQQR
jgi:hypothetical protein